MLDLFNPEALKFQIALTLIDGVGDRIAKRLIAYCGGVEAVFCERPARLRAIPGIGDPVARAVGSQQVLGRAEEEVEFVLANGIQPVFFLDDAYPERLRHCDDGPVLLYTQGKIDFHNPRVVSVIGTRRSTRYGTSWCRDFMEGLRPYGALVVSGLAYGIDICAHREALEQGLPTAAVLAHGLDRIYPRLHEDTAYAMQENGGLITEFMHGSNADRENFPRRNRIVAGLADATIVVESDLTGGAMITASIAHSYNRDVFAVPGPVGDNRSKGCNALIRRNRAALLESAEDLAEYMGWELDEKQPDATQVRLFPDLSETEQAIVDVLKNQGETGIDLLGERCELPASEVANTLLDLEFSGVVKSLPGNVYSLN